MAFQTPITIKKLLDHIQRHEYVLPAIQREFVWKPNQICRLFDSLMQGYPIGSFLFWRVERENTRVFKFYDFVRNYHQKTAPHCPSLNLIGDREVTAILDGQQRLTSLNIGLLGSHASKEPRKWWDNPDAFPLKRLYLNLVALAGDNEEGMKYDFRFLTEDRASQRDDGQFWFPVWKIIDIEPGPGIHEYLLENELASNREAFRLIHGLHGVIHDKPIINFFLEEEQDLDKVLNIFIRVNSGGTELSYSDLLLSIATAQWEDLDARKTIHLLVDDLNGTGNGFQFSKDFVLKAGLMLSDIASVGFKVTNFDARNMHVLAENWPRIEKALRQCVRLAADFGYSGQTLTADSALLPIAYYLYRRQFPDSYLLAREHRDDREAIRQWLVRSLLKPGIWGSGLDTMLTTIRAEIQEHGQERFPTEAIETAMVRRGRSLRFEEDEIQDLVDIEYGDRREFAVLSLLYPFIDLRNEFHVDHIFPRARFTTARLGKEGITGSTAEQLQGRVNRLGNLQLLQGATNQEKSDQLPSVWIEAQFPAPQHRQDYLDRHDLGVLPANVAGFNGFYEARRDRLAARLRQILGVALKEGASA